MADYGTDVSCTDGLQTGVLVSGNRLLAQALYRRLITPRGMLRGGEKEADYGIDLVGLIGNINYPGMLAALPGQIRSECLKDERVSDVSATVEESEDSAGAVTYLITISVTPEDGSEFDFLMSVNDATAALFGYTE